MTAVQYAIADTLVLAKRSLKRIPRQPDLLVGFTIQPIMFVLLFVYVFGGAIDTEPLDYVDFLIPGIIVQSMVFGGFVTALGLSEDLKKGLIDRFRSLPIWRPAPLVGSLLGDSVRYVIAGTVIIVVGVILGYRPGAGVTGVLAALALVVVFSFGLSWVFTTLGLLLRSPNAVMNAGFMGIFPLTFLSNVFVDPSTLPSGSRKAAK